MKAGETRVGGDDIHRRAFLQRALGAVTLASSGGLIGAAVKARASALDIETIVSGNTTWPTGRTIAAGERLVFDPNVSTTVTVSGGNVIVEGTLIMRPANPAVVHTLRFTNVNEADFVGGGDVPLASDRGLWVTGAGKLDLAGSAKLPWTRLTSELGAGAMTLTLPVDPVGWEVGDQIAVTPTLPPWWGGYRADLTYDERTITAISGGSITLNAPLKFAHPLASVGRGIVLGAEVLNLTRNVIIGGTATGKSHIAIIAAAQQALAHLRIEHMGPRKYVGVRDKDGVDVRELVLGRYGLHFHRMKDASRGTVVDGVVITDTNSRAFVAHDSHGITYRQCIAHRTMYSQYWWDAFSDPTVFTNDTLHDRCVASMRIPVNWKTSTPDPDSRQAGFDMTAGAGNILRDCVAVGGENGRDAAGIWWQASGSGTWAFEGLNVSHNNGQHGSAAWENGNGNRDVRNLVLYHNARFGIFHGAYLNNYHYTGVTCHRNGAGAVQLHALTRGSPDFQQWTDCLFDASGARSCVDDNDHRFATSRPVRFTRCEFKNPGIAHVEKVRHDKGGVLEFVNCTFTSGRPEFRLGAAPVGTEWRVQDATRGSIALTPDRKPSSVWNPTWQAYVRRIPPLRVSSAKVR